MFATFLCACEPFPNTCEHIGLIAQCHVCKLLRERNQFLGCLGIPTKELLAASQLLKFLTDFEQLDRKPQQNRGFLNRGSGMPGSFASERVEFPRVVHKVRAGDRGNVSPFLVAGRESTVEAVISTFRGIQRLDCGMVAEA